MKRGGLLYYHIVRALLLYRLLLLGLLGLVLVLTLGAPTEKLNAAERPNILFILADDLGFGDTGITGQNDRAAAGLPAFTTPNIDSIAQQGVQFTNMYSSAPVCAPARLSLLTGFHQAHLVKDRVHDTTDVRAGTEDYTWGQMLQEAGYTTGMFGKWHLGGFNSYLSVRNPSATPVAKGFHSVYGSMVGGYRVPNVWETDGQGGMLLTSVPPDPSWTGSGPPNEYTEDSVARRARQFIRNASKLDQPFAAYAAFMAPHAPLDKYPQGDYANESWPDPQKHYASMISRLDEHVGQLLEALDDPNGDGDTSDSMSSETLVVFTSDNGALWPNHNSNFDPDFFESNGQFSDYKASQKEGGIHAPFFARWNGVIEPGTLNDSHVGSFSDIMPTFAELSGGKTPLGVDGKSMLKTLIGNGPTERPDALTWSFYTEFDNRPFHGWAVRMGDWKLIKNIPTDTYQLYNISNDPSEQDNLAAERGDIVAALKQVALDEGADQEPLTIIRPNGSSYTENTYFTQYKTWSPQEASSDFFSAANWSGGTQTTFEGGPEAQNWNSGPADNWLATMVNTSGGNQSVTMSSDAKFLALEIAASAGSMTLNVSNAATLTARNGIRVSEGGHLNLAQSSLNTIREIDIRPGGVLSGSGTISGQQKVIEGIPEFQGLGLLEPELINSGSIVLQHEGGAGIISVAGDFRQESSGTLAVDLFNNSGVPGVSFDQLLVEGLAIVDGTIQINLVEGFLPEWGDRFPVITAEDLTVESLSLTGGFANLFSYETTNDSLQLVFADADFTSDGIINDADLLVWQSHYGLDSATLAEGDANADGVVDGQDFLVWQRQLGGTLSLQTLTKVPEPCGLMLCLLAVALLFGKRVRENSRLC